SRGVLPRVIAVPKSVRARASSPPVQSTCASGYSARKSATADAALLCPIAAPAHSPRTAAAVSPNRLPILSFLDMSEPLTQAGASTHAPALSPRTRVPQWAQHPRVTRSILGDWPEHKTILRAFRLAARKWGELLPPFGGT